AVSKMDEGEEYAPAREPKAPVSEEITTKSTVVGPPAIGATMSGNLIPRDWLKDFVIPAILTANASGDWLYVGTAVTSCRDTLSPFLSTESSIFAEGPENNFISY